MIRCPKKWDHGGAYGWVQCDLPKGHEGCCRLLPPKELTATSSADEETTNVSA